MAEQQATGVLQPLRQFTAQVRKGDDTIVGTAFAVNFRDGLLLTCKHVVEAASQERSAAQGTSVKLYFPLIRGEDKLFTAQVAHCFTDHDDDVVILKLDEPPLPDGVETAILGAASASVGRNPVHGFRSFGFRRRSEYQGLPAWGNIIDFTLAPQGRTLHTEPIMLQSEHIDRGMSGAAVLDMERNVVVGIIAENWDSGRSHMDANTGFAVDNAVVRFFSDDLPIRFEGRLDLSQDPPPSEQAQKAANVATRQRDFPLPPAYHPAEPPVLDEWVGREELLRQLDADYADAQVHITSLIGFGGEGKSSLAYRWMAQALEKDPPEAAFWWNFYDNRSFEAMLETAATYLYGEMAQTWRSTSGRVEAIGALLRERRVLLVLDGFEVMQEDSGDRYGSVSNKDVLRLLELFAQGEHNSYCLVTSRAPLLDLLVTHTAQRQRDVTRLEKSDGIDLLRNVGVRGDDATLRRIVNDWEGHALTVSLIGSYLRDVHRGDAGQYSVELFPELDEQAERDTEGRYKGVSRILRRYDEQLSEAQRAFLKLFSVFRLPVPESSFERVFRTETSNPTPDPLPKALGRGAALNAPLVTLSDNEFTALVQGLEDRRLIRQNAASYSTHPLVRNHYLHLLERESREDQTAVHQAAAAQYQESAAEPGRFPTLDDLQPYIEVVYHLCRAGAYDEAWDVYWGRISQQNSHVILHQLGAYETSLNLLLEFFPDRDPSNEPGVSNPGDKRFIVNGIGFRLMNLGRLAEAAPFYERKNRIALDMGDHHNASVGYQNLTEVYRQTGALAQAAETAAQALAQARQVADEQERKQGEMISLAWQAWIDHLRGELTTAGEGFQQAEALEIEVGAMKGTNEQYLYSIRGIQHADHLRRLSQADYARRITVANLKGWVANYGWKQDESLCHRVLGDLEADAGDGEGTRSHYEQALMIARGIDRRDVLIEALIAYGHWRGLHGGEVAAGLVMLDEALAYCLESGYLLYEADVRVALAAIALKEGDTVTAADEASRALAIGYRTGYHWAKVDSQAVLDQLGG